MGKIYRILLSSAIPVSPGRLAENYPGFKLFIPVVNLFWGLYLVFHVPGLIKQMELQDNIPMEEQTNAGMIGAAVDSTEFGESVGEC